MIPQLRDTLVFDATASTGASYEINLPRTQTATDTDGNPIYTPTVAVGDWGVVLATWSAVSGSPLTGLVVVGSAWATLVPPTVANQICFSVITKQVTQDDIDNQTFGIVLDTSMYLLVVGAWWSGVAQVDAVGPLGINPNAVLTTATAPSMPASGVTDELIVALFSTAVTTGGALSLNQGTAVVDQVGNANTVRGTIASLAGTGLGPTGDVVATYDFGSQSRAGMQIGLLAVGAGVGGVPGFTPSVTLSAVGTAISSSTAAFATTVSLAGTGLVGSRAFFTPTVTLGAQGQRIVSVGFAPSVTLAAAGRRISPATFRTTIALGTTGTLRGLAAITLGPAVTLSTRGGKRVAGTASFGPTVTLAATGVAVHRARPFFSTQVTLAAEGSPVIAGVDAHFSARLFLYTQRPVVRAAATPAPHFGPTLALRAKAVLMAQAANANFTPQVVLSVLGTPDFTPVGAAEFRPTVTLAADGFARPAEPVGITVKPIKVEPDPAWHGTPKPEYDWQADLPVGQASFDLTVTLEAEGFDPSLVVAGHTWSTG